MSQISIGIDTSNYKTSIAAVDKDNNILYDERLFLSVPDGEKGLRQQEALFQHVKRLPRLIKDMFKYIDKKDVEVIAVSNKPRPLSDSYMPCFLAGESIAKSIASTLGLECKEFSHQEGHIEAGKRFSPLKNKEEFIAFHFSGGTTEVLKVTKNKISIIGGTKDISYGQLIDRIGVAIGYPFPSGEEIDNGAMRASSGGYIYNNELNLADDFSKIYKDNNVTKIIPKISVNSPYINLSGIETAIINKLDDQLSQDYKDELSLGLLVRIGDSILDLMDLVSKEERMNDFLFVGGVSSSSFMRSYIEKEIKNKNINASFAAPDLASDNAVGIAFLGGDAIWQ